MWAHSAGVTGVAGVLCYVFCLCCLLFMAGYGYYEGGEHKYKLRGVWITKKEWPGNSNYQLYACHMQQIYLEMVRDA